MSNRASKAEVAELRLQINNLESWVKFFIQEKASLDNKIASTSKAISELSERVKKLEKE